MISTRQFDVEPMAARLVRSDRGLAASHHRQYRDHRAALNRENGLASMIEQLIAAADRTMYSAKRNGGNRVQHA